MATAKFTQLPNRATITVGGADRVSFLQGLLTQDMALLDTQPLVYACLLTPQGKFLYNLFLRVEGDTIVIDCEGGERANALLSTLKKYKLRTAVTLELMDDTPVFQIFSPRHCEERSDAAIHVQDDIAFKDPRHAACGYRAYSKPDLAESTFDEWDTHRIQNEIPDGSRDLIPQKSFIHEARLDDFNAVSYTKGCYVGQELVSRMHHRGLTKKILKCVNVNDVPNNAELRSTCGDVGLALVRL